MSQQTTRRRRFAPLAAGVRDRLSGATGTLTSVQRLKAENKQLRKQIRRLGGTAPDTKPRVQPGVTLPLPPARVTKALEGDEKTIVDAFHVLYKDVRKIEKATWFLGVRVYKCPFDLWVYQELIHELKPDLIVETGTLHGGSALYLASMMDLVDKGEIITIDVAPGEGVRPEHPRVTYVTGSSIDPEIVERVRQRAESADAVLVLLDSDHRKKHVLAEMRAYGPIVTRGSYMVVEDTNINGHPTHAGWGEGPMEAVEEFMKETDEFVIDRAREKFMVTFNPSGWLRRT
jgi:cephalosporin hydroxylase